MNADPAYRSRRMRGFTLIEIMVVVVIIGLLVGIVAPNVMERLRRAEVQRAETDIEGIKTALEFFYMDHHRYPTADEGLEVLRGEGEIDGHPVAEHLKKEPVDPWGRPYYYEYPSSHGDDYDIYTLGADGEEGGDDANADIGSWDRG